MGCFQLSLLVTLILRLYVTFKGSIFRMKSHIICLFTVILVSWTIAFTLFTVAIIIFFEGNESGYTLSVYSFCIALLLYFVGSALAVRVFSRKLSKLARMVKKTPRSKSKPYDLSRLPSLNEHQVRMLNVSAKYILLFLFAVFSTISSCVSMFILSMEMSGLFISLDFCINLFCLYLQFNFATEHYEVCCRCMDTRCRKLVAHRTRTVMHRESLRDLQILNSVSPPPSPASPALAPSPVGALSLNDVQSLSASPPPSDTELGPKITEIHGMEIVNSNSYLSS